MSWLKTHAKPLIALAVAILTALLAFLTSCGAPQYAVVPSTADNALTFKRTSDGVDVGVRVGADTTAGLQSAAFKNKDGTEASLSGLAFTANPSSSIAAQPDAMLAYALQQQRYYGGLTDITNANWTGFTSALSIAAPLAGSYLEGLNRLRLAEAQQPTLVQQLANLVTAGTLSPSALETLGASPTIIAAVNRHVDARLAEIAATTQPATP